MPIRDFELFHGAVLTKIVRSDRPIALRMIETKPNESWAFYTINDEVDLLIKYSKKSAQRKREPYTVWQFIFSPEQIKQMNKIRSDQRGLCIALVCGQEGIGEPMHVCFLQPDHIGRLFKIDEEKSQSITVKFTPRKMLRVITDYQDELLIAQNALDKWHVPGS